jgi:antitoxin (DNA-binding transcriptional repressor) of toxin-antitoxin stability system
MNKLNLHEVKARFSECIEMVESGESIVVCKRNIPVAEIRPIVTKTRRKPVLGSAARGFQVAPISPSPMSKDEVRFWEQGDAKDPLRKYAPKSRRKRSK